MVTVIIIIWLIYIVLFVHVLLYLCIKIGFQFVLLNYMYLVCFRVTPDGETQFAGWARMALQILDFSIVEVFFKCFTSETPLNEHHWDQ